MGKKRRQKKMLFITAGGIVVATGVVAGVFIYKGMTKSTREETIETYMGYIEKQQYEDMYALLDSASKDEISKDDFIARNRNIYQGIEAEDISLEIPQKQDKNQPLSYRVQMNTLAGEITYDTDTFFKKEDGQWHISWNDSMIFPGLEKKDKVRVSAIEAERGKIYDRNHVLLAGKGTVESIGLVPGKMNIQPEEDLKVLSEILGIEEETIKARLEASWVKEDSFVPLKKMTQEQLDMPYKTRDGIVPGGSIQDQLLTHPGVLISKAESRVYPYGECTSHLLGYVQQIQADELEERKGQGYNEYSIIGKSGLEKVFEQRLREKKGHKITIVDENGEEKETLAIKEAKDGEDIVLTIDIEWQQQLYNIYKEDKSCSVVMNPTSGQVLAFVSTPSYNAMDFIVGMTQEKWDGLNNDENKPMFNRAREIWSPGSSFKPIVGAIGLTTNAITEDEDLGERELSWQKDDSWGNYKITTLHGYDNGILRNALMYSDNIYFAKTALKIGQESMENQLNKLGFNQDIPFELGVSSSIYSNSKTIESEIQLADSGYGQGQILVSPLHLACMYSGFFNEGNMIAPYLEYIEGKDPVYWVENAFTKEAAETIYEDLKEVVNNQNGTAFAASFVPNVSLAGKTGTAEIKKNQDDQNGTELGWFAVYNTDVSKEDTVLMVNMVEDVKNRGGSGYVVKKDVEVFTEMMK